MVWQDMVFLVGNFVLAAVLLPIVKDEEASVPLWTSIPTLAMLYIYAFTFVTMELYLSAAGTALTAGFWTFIAAFRR